MKAWVLHGVNDLRLEEVPVPELKAGEVLVEVRAAGICGSDIPRIYKTGTYTFPTIPGHEFSGQVVKTGPGADSGWLGKRVGIFPLIPCRTCAPCRRGMYELCRHYSYLGSRQNGGFAEYAAVPAENLLELPANAAFEEAAMLEPMAVAVHALRGLAPGPQETAAVCGLGTIGMLLIMFLRDAGVKNILAVGNKEFQRYMLSEQGVSGENFCDCSRENAAAWLMDKTGGHGVDVFFECVGKNETLSQALDAAAPGGRVCLVGNPVSTMTLQKDTYWKILRNQLTLMGTWNSRFSHTPLDDWAYALDRLQAGRVYPGAIITHRFALEEMKQALLIMRNKSQPYVKIIVEFGVTELQKNKEPR